MSRILPLVLCACVTLLPSAEPRDTDPTQFTPGQLAAIRGAMWTARVAVPYGPRPGRASNPIAFTFYQLYSADDRARMVAAYKSRGYTHVVVGPAAGTDCYHGKYPCHDPSIHGSWPADDVPSQSQWDGFLDSVQELWDAELIPIYFAKPDKWEQPQYAAKLDALDALHRQDRAQRLLRVVVYTGWEPTGWTRDTYMRMVRRGADVFPSAVRFLHTACGSEPPPDVAPFIHGWLIQTCGYIDGGTPRASDTVIREWQATIADRAAAFRNGERGWPRDSAWGSGVPLLLIAAEYASYADFWRDWPENEARRLGDAAMDAGADGYLDGGTVVVPVRR